MAIRVNIGSSGNIKVLAGLPSYDGTRWNDTKWGVATDPMARS